MMEHIRLFTCNLCIKFSYFLIIKPQPLHFSVVPILQRFVTFRVAVYAVQTRLVPLFDIACGLNVYEEHLGNIEPAALRAPAVGIFPRYGVKIILTPHPEAVVYERQTVGYHVHKLRYLRHIIVPKYQCAVVTEHAAAFRKPIRAPVHISVYLVPISLADVVGRVSKNHIHRPVGNILHQLQAVALH